MTKAASHNGSNGHSNGRKPALQQSAEMILDRPAPRDLTAEMNVLGSICLQPDCLDELATRLNASDFSDDDNRKLYEHLTAMHDAGRQIDSTLLVNRLRAADDLDSIGGVAYLARIANSVPHAAHVKHYAGIVREKSIYRRLILKSTELLRDAYDELYPSQEMINRAESEFAEIAETTLEATDAPPFHQAVLDAIANIEARTAGQIRGISSGIGSYDRAANGMKRGDLVILAGRPSQGKSAMASGIAAHVAREDQRAVCFISLEMNRQEIVERILASEAHVDYSRMVRNDLSPEERPLVTDCVETLCHRKIHIDDHPYRSVAQIAAQARRVKRKHGLSLLVVDYLQLIEPDNSKETRQEQVAKIARRLKGIARELEVPVLCLAQLNRQVEQTKDFRPRLAHLRESGSIEQDADHVLFVHRPKWYRNEQPQDGSGEEAELILAKIRNGPTMIVPMLWFGRWMRWETPAGPQFHDAQPYVDGGATF